jgi:tellurite methyltransferase
LPQKNNSLGLKSDYLFLKKSEMTQLYGITLSVIFETTLRMNSAKASARIVVSNITPASRRGYNFPLTKHNEPGSRSTRQQHMAEKDREKWDSKYLQHIGNLAPSKLLETFIDHAPPGKALDIACGNGRNSIFLSKHGFTVDAVDISTVATKSLREQAGINVQCMDIDEWTIPENSYELIINIRFLDRRLFPMIVKGLKPGGLLIFESFTGGKNEQFNLRPNELLYVFEGLHVIYYEEKILEKSDRFEKSAALVAQKSER